jgi:dihydrolipoamide dehydrogenase
MGLKTACVEMRGRLGGTCLNVGCIPSKALLQSSHHYYDAKHHFAQHGIEIENVKMNVTKMQESKAATVEGLTGGIEYLLKKYGVEYFKGKGSLVANTQVQVAPTDGTAATILDTKNVIIATGSEVTPLPPVPVDNAAGKIVDSTGALEISAIPETMAVIGGGVIGLEMGSVWARLGTKVTVLEFMDRICPSMDLDLTKKFQTTLKKQGFKFQLKTKVTASEMDADGKIVLTTESAKGTGEPKTQVFDTVLVATGRRPYTMGLGLEDLGIAMDKLGRVQVDEHFRTAVPNIYAIGDCIDGPMLAHKAEEEGIAAVETIAGFAGHVNYDAIPGKGGIVWCCFCHFVFVCGICADYSFFVVSRNRRDLHLPRSRFGRKDGRRPQRSWHCVQNRKLSVRRKQSRPGQCLDGRFRQSLGRRQNGQDLGGTHYRRQCR